MSRVGTCTRCYATYTTRRRRGTYCAWCRFWTWPSRMRRLILIYKYDAHTLAASKFFSLRHRRLRRRHLPE